MVKVLVIVVLVLYTAAMLFILLYSLSQAHLLWSYLKKTKRAATPGAAPLRSVTIQLPVYNEQYVVERLIDNVCAIDYPRQLLEIQVLDDSTDGSEVLAAARAAHWRAKGINIQHIRRSSRTGFKAGALRHGLQEATGEFIAIFDADFMPAPDFLLRVMPCFASEKTGMVQTRWDHQNRNHSLLTRLQAFALDAHFTVEQTGRNQLGAFINFNGTAGVWRRQAIEDAGNWQDDTLTEDLDLSYRAQLRGWQFVYLEEVLSPAELPMVMSAVKGQQYRWNKGGAEVARKMLAAVWHSRLPLFKKIHGSLHLLNSAVFVAIFTSACLSLPLVFIKAAYPEYRVWIAGGSLSLLSFAVIGITYFVANRRHFSSKAAWMAYLVYFPVFLSVSMGLSFHNALAVLEGYAGRRTPFIRTPKFNIAEGSSDWKKNIYLGRGFSVSMLAEILLTLCFGFAIYTDFRLGDYALLPFHMMLCCGFGAVAGWSVAHAGRHS